MSEISVGEQLCSQIRRTEQALIAHHEAVLRSYGLTMTQYAVLRTLLREGGLSGAQLARASGVTQQTMTTVLTGLQTKDLIAREPSALHARVMIATLTKQGRQVLKNAYKKVDVLEGELTDAFTPAERATFCELLARATATFRRQTAKIDS